MLMALANKINSPIEFVVSLYEKLDVVHKTFHTNNYFSIKANNHCYSYFYTTRFPCSPV